MYIRNFDLETIYGLDVITKFFREMERLDIFYCHWKSNEHLREGLLGITDLDVLVEKGKTSELNKVLFDSGFKLFNAMATHGYPAVADYLAVDNITGKMVHLHLHYQLICGEPHLKGYRLPWEHQILASRQYDEEENVYVVEPNMEMLLLIVRSVMKLRARDWILDKLGRHYFSSDRLREFQWLNERISPSCMIELTDTLIGKEAAAQIEDIITTPTPSLKQILRFQKSAKQTIQLFRTYSPLYARWRRTVRELYWLCGGVNKRYIHAPVPLRRISASGGLLIALMGCDGSGKSTQVQAITKWLSWKVDVIPLYFGSGNGSSSLLRWPLKLAAKLLHKVPVNGSARDQVDTSMDYKSVQPSLFKMLPKAIWAVTLSIEKRRKLRQATAARNRGMVVLCDRYPQNQMMGFNDGPLLSAWLNHRWQILRAIAVWESQPYREAEIYLPDVVIKLNVSSAVATKRKSDISLEECKRRVNAIDNLQYPAPTRIVNIDANQPLEQVLLEVKHAIWREF
ncbi:hypothetical protein HWV00_05585 [Moritella sp. 24]|uniref:hypothetical protein n=1 Tax=Moritella sp. 24 TaxID=2746230 RepID=UPI001BAB159A|nr:hypothetical protein [Moritella sp. 24]QUM75743.1 hypothetical protein HWV00_05585 [Moritella sp. 24]